MFFRSLACFLLIAALFTGCQTPAEKQKKAEKKAAEAKKKDAPPTMEDQSSDVSFQSFVSRLRQAVERHDRATIAPMLDANFGWRWDNPPQGETPFDYWDQNNLWPELVNLLSGRFTPHENYMVAPPAFVTDPAYKGFRMGIRSVNGSWRFAYFITGEDVLQ